VLDDFTHVSPFATPDDSMVFQEFVRLINIYISEEFFHRNQPAHVPHTIELGQSHFLSWEPSQELLSIFLPCPCSSNIENDELLALHVFKELYLVLPLHSYSSSMVGTRSTS
jgi:hypothetical protein